jgi:hypothetical protein
VTAAGQLGDLFLLSCEHITRFVRARAHHVAGGR